MGPITGQGNMNLPEKELLARLSPIPGYVAGFDSAFGEGGVTRERIEQSLATYERSIVSTNAPFDRWIHGEEVAISAAAKRGFALFNGKANCAVCHSGWAFTDGSFHDIGVAKDDDLGRGRLFANSVKLPHRRQASASRLRLASPHGGDSRDTAEVRAAHFSRELDRFVIEALRAVKRQSGEQAFNRTARDLLISVCAILAYERGTDVVVGLFDMIERVLTDDCEG